MPRINDYKIVTKFYRIQSPAPTSFYAFRPGHSTSMCINALINMVYALKSKGYHVLGFCVNDYDCVCVEILKSQLESLGVNDGGIISSTGFVHGSRVVTVNGGLAQGSALRPLLFNAYTVSLHKIQSENCVLFQYEDDFFLLVFQREFEPARSLLDANISRPHYLPHGLRRLEHS